MKLGRFNHHPDPAIDFCIEVEVIEAEWLNIRHGFTNGTPQQSEIVKRLAKAMQFCVGGDAQAVAAKDILRRIEKETTELSAPAVSDETGRVSIGVDFGSGDQTALTLRHGDLVFTFFGQEAEAIAAALSAAPVAQEPVAHEAIRKMDECDAARIGHDWLNAIAASLPSHPSNEITQAKVGNDGCMFTLWHKNHVHAAIVTVRDDFNFTQLLRFDARPTPPAPAASVGARRGIYIASKTYHADRWRFLRDKVGEPIVSTWIDEAGEGQTADFHDLWQRCLSEAANCGILIAYREKDEIFKGGWVEIGAALSAGVPVYAVGLEDFTIAKYRGITHFPDMKSAVAASRVLLSRAEGESDQKSGANT